jgi:hypothetical protein
MNVTMTATADVSVLERAIPRMVAFGRRTMQEQCVTSVTFISLRARKLTPAADIGRIDAELEVEVSPVLSTRGKRKGLPLKSGKKSVGTKPGVRVPLITLITMARMNPASDFNLRTGGKWAIPSVILPRGPGTARDRQMIIGHINQRSVMARHSSTHYLQTGWTSSIRQGLASPLYRYNPAFGSRRDARANPNSSNQRSVDDFGQLTIDLRGDECVVTATNNIGDKGNAVLASKHRAALLEYGTGPMNQAIAEEAAGIDREVERRLELGWKVKFPELL